MSSAFGFALLMLLCGGCSPPPPDNHAAAPTDTAAGSVRVSVDTAVTPDFQPAIGLALKDDGRTVTLAPGQVVEVSLMANAKAGEQWVLTDSASAVLARAGSISYADEASGSRFQNFRFRAAAAGRATLGFARRGGASTMPVRYTVVVR